MYTSVKHIIDNILSVFPPNTSTGLPVVSGQGPDLLSLYECERSDTVTMAQAQPESARHC